MTRAHEGEPKSRAHTIVNTRIGITWIRRCGRRRCRRRSRRRCCCRCRRRRRGSARRCGCWRGAAVARVEWRAVVVYLTVAIEAGRRRRCCTWIINLLTASARVYIGTEAAETVGTVGLTNAAVHARIGQAGHVLGWIDEVQCQLGLTV